jgi:hypothetical protein
MKAASRQLTILEVYSLLLEIEASAVRNDVASKPWAVPEVHGELAWKPVWGSAVASPPFSLAIESRSLGQKTPAGSWATFGPLEGHPRH